MEFLALFLDSIFNLSAGQTEKPFLGWAPLGEDLTHVKSFSRIPQKMPTVRTCIILNPKVEVSAKFNSDIESRFAKVCQTMKEEKEKEVAAEPENRTFEKNNSKEF
ncbi:hypothetical protein TNCT_671052 [Trichonephila clavata]|uniref:Uncharacterized protein n=1 Tax=Trichonephila clavata TaxID=2740835 RepID=A0A8X6LRL5_TRICU|nr:hypothetical protein TNCT_671052 [Trichonephila clavata]